MRGFRQLGSTEALPHTRARLRRGGTGRSGSYLSQVPSQGNKLESGEATKASRAACYLPQIPRLLLHLWGLGRERHQDGDRPSGTEQSPRRSPVCLSSLISFGRFPSISGVTFMARHFQRFRPSPAPTTSLMFTKLARDATGEIRS